MVDRFHLSEEECVAQIERRAAELRARGETPVVLVLDARGRRLDGIPLGPEAVAVQVLSKEAAVALLDKRCGGRAARFLGFPTDSLGEDFRFLLLRCPAGPVVTVEVVAGYDGQLYRVGGGSLDLETFRIRRPPEGKEEQW